jgi:hypothetical protein
VSDVNDLFCPEMTDINDKSIPPEDFVRKLIPSKKHGKNMRRLTKLVCKAFLNPCKQF